MLKKLCFAPLTSVFRTLVIAFSVCASSVYAQSGIDPQEVVKDTQIMSQTAQKLRLVWWLPEQYWMASLEKNKAVSRLQIEQITQVLKPYLMLAVVDAQVGAIGSLTYQTEAILRNSISVTDSKGFVHTAIEESRIAPDMRNLLQMLRPVLSNALGPLGNNMQFYLFNANDKDGKMIADASKEGLLRVTVSGEEFKYRLPIGSVLPPKYNSQTSEKFPGNYKFDPFTGRELTSVAPVKN